MAKDEATSVKDAVHKLQLFLLEGIHDEGQLFAAGSVMSRSDYQDVVTERSIAKTCGYPLCRNPLPSEQPQKGRYRISLKEHKVYDLQETYMYCSRSCAINSRSFSGSLQEERCSVLNPVKLRELLRLFEGLNLKSETDLGGNGDLGLSELKIQEKAGTPAGEVSLEEWIGPSNAIEGYVPQQDSSSKPACFKDFKTESRPRHEQLDKDKGIMINEVDFTSTIITQDEYSISKSLPIEKAASSRDVEEPKGKRNFRTKDQATMLETSAGHAQSCYQISAKESDEEMKLETVNDKPGILKVACPDESNLTSSKQEKGLSFGKVSSSNSTVLKPSLKPSGVRKATRSVTWADKKTEGNATKNLCEFKESDDGKEVAERSSSPDTNKDDNSYRLASAEACASALSQAAEAIASGSNISDAVSEAGIIILPPPEEVDKSKSLENGHMLHTEPAPLKWPRKPGLSNLDPFDPDDSWYDSPPEGFSLTLSPFATMFMALFAWISSSTLAFIYGHDESSSEEYLSVNGREYPRKIVLTDGRSSEIKQTLAGCLARALPGLVADLRLPLPISTLEQGMACLLDTMSFIEPLPSFRMKQWQAIVILLLDALSVCRIPALTPYMTGRRVLLPKVLDAARISAEEYEIMKDLIIPLGRVPQFSMQSGA